MANKDLQRAKAAKKDEFYTQLSDIENELKHYIDDKKGVNPFKDKIVFCNCDDPAYSHFWYYFVSNFTELGLKKLISTHYISEQGAKSYKLELTREMVQENPDLTIPAKINEKGEYTFKETPPPKQLKENGDFRSAECIKLLKEADIVVTNPPFSLLREYVAQLMEYNKKFIIIIPFNAISYKEIFKLIKENRIWLGYGFRGGNAYFKVDKEVGKLFVKGVYDEKTGLLKFRNVTWATNLDHEKLHEKLILTEYYDKEKYPKYDNYDAINVDKVKDIPKDYKGAMGVPITFLDKRNPEQFDILALGIVGSIDFTCNKKMEILDKFGKPTGKFTINAKGTLYRKFNSKTDKAPAFKDCETGELYSSIYARIIVKNKLFKKD